MIRRGRPPRNPERKIRSRPLRTREHVIADLSVLHLQWIVARCGYVAEKPEHDYGYDLALYTYTEVGEIENGSVLFQLKATDDLKKYVTRGGKTISFPIARRHVDLWRGEPMPVILVIYDAAKERSYWLYTQRYFQATGMFLADDQAEISLHVPVANVVDASTIQTFRDLKQDALHRVREASVHGE